MRFLRQLARRLAQALAVLRDPDAGLLAPLPEPTVDPRTNADQLARDAREQGRSDGKRYLYDGWSFGLADDGPETILDPEYVRLLRHRCESAVREHRDRQQLTEARLADLHEITQDADRNMRSARDRMARVAARDQLDEDDSLRAFLHRRNVNADDLRLPPIDHQVWEGEAPPMRLHWRVLIVLVLGAVVFEIEHYVAEAYLPAAGVGATTALLLTAAMAGLTILGPLVSGQLFRNRHATGYDRILAALTFVLLLPTLAIILGFGLLAAHLFDHGVTAQTAGPIDQSRSAGLGLTPATLIVVFDVVLFLAGAMAYILGLAQRHPFQQAFARNRQLRNETIYLSQRLGTRINPDYRSRVTGSDRRRGLDDPPRPAPTGGEGDGEGAAPEPAGHDREMAVRHGYFAAEEAYYQGLIEAVADPTFTDAVMRRRNRHPEPPPGPPAGPQHQDQDQDEGDPS